MKTGEIDIVITGADRIAANGDFANKIGTYEKAVIANENNIPFYVAAPISTFDKTIKTGDEITIEERGREELSTINNSKILLFGILASQNRLAGYSLFLSEDYYKDLEVHSVALVYPNFCLQQDFSKS